MRYYNHERLHSAIGFVTPAAMLAGQAAAIWAARDQKLEAARAARRTQWQDISAPSHQALRVVH